MGRQQEISRIAYELYLQRGASADPFEDWAKAERMYQERTNQGSIEGEKSLPVAANVGKRKISTHPLEPSRKKSKNPGTSAR